MRTSHRLRSLIVALLIAAQPASAAYASGALGFGAPCPVHAALMAPQADQPGMHQHQHAAHEGHGAMHQSPVQSDEGETPDNSVFGYNCCAGHLAGICASVPVLAGAHWIFVKSFVVPLVPAQASLPTADPPPRFFL